MLDQLSDGAFYAIIIVAVVVILWWLGVFNGIKIGVDEKKAPEPNPQVPKDSKDPPARPPVGPSDIDTNVGAAGNPNDQSGINTGVGNAGVPVIVAAVLYKGNNYTGDSISLTPGRSIKLFDNKPNCTSGGGTNPYCWNYFYTSMKVQPGYDIQFMRKDFTLMLKTNSTGNMPVLDTDVLMSYMDPSISVSSRIGRLGFYYPHWPGPGYVRLVKSA